MAVKTIDEPVIFQKVTAYICDCCHKEYTDDVDMQEFLCFHNTGGYGSVFGDGAEMNVDLCQHCVKKLLGEFMQFKQEIWDESSTMPEV